MDNLIDSNERTLVIFDSVCNGLSECLALVHADIKQMSEHRNQLALIEQEKLQAKQPSDSHQQPKDTSSESIQKRSMQTTDLDVTDPAPAGDKDGDDSAADDPHHLARLKLLDKRLADSFSQALSMCDQQKTSLNAKKHHHSQSLTSSSTAGSHRPSIFQMLLGKGSSYKNQVGDNLTKRRQSKSSKEVNGGADLGDGESRAESQVIIDDISKQTRLAMQYSKQLEAHLFKVEDLRTRYEMHLEMGLLVKGLSRSYAAKASAASVHIHSPNSLGRRPHHYPQNCNSPLTVNDCSSLATTNSSLSSLNLSSWSFSRRAANRSDHSSSRKDSMASGGDCTNSAAACCKLAMDQDRQSQKYMSTISLDSLSRRNKQLNLAKMISKSTSKQHASQAPVCQCQLANCRGASAIDSTYPPKYLDGGDARPPSGQFNYTDPATPTATGNPTAVGEKIFISNSGALLHKSASHLSLKDKGKRLKSGQQALMTGGKTTIKEFMENIERIESEFESYMGSFLLNIEDIQGFARVCQGDVFEINIKYGNSQKFKTKISVLKDSRQKCDNRQTVFKARIADVIAIKAYECKGLGKKVMLGHKLCETCDLFTARSQLMTISLNQTGSIKLNLVITWNPLHMAPNSSLALQPGLDISHISLPPTPVSSSTLSSLSSGHSLPNGLSNSSSSNNNNNNNNTTMINIQSSNSIGSSNSTGRTHRTKVPVHQVQQVSPSVGALKTASGFHNQQHPHAHQRQQLSHHNHMRYQQQRELVRELHAKHYHDVDPTYGYYIPEPDYQTSDIRH